MKRCGIIGLVPALLVPLGSGTALAQEGDIALVKIGPHDWMYELVSDVDPEGAGNGNGAVDAGETVEMHLALKNISQKDYLSTSGFLSTQDQYIEILPPLSRVWKADPGEVIYDEIYPGKAVKSPYPYRFRVNSKCPDGHLVDFELLIRDTDFGPTRLHFPLVVYNVGPLVVGEVGIDDDIPGPSSGDGDGRLEAGETIELRLQIKNEGTPDISDVTATLSSEVGFLQILEAEHHYDRIPGHQARGTAADYDFDIVGEKGRGNQDRTGAQGILVLTTQGTAHGFRYHWRKESQQTVYGVGRGKFPPGETTGGSTFTNQTDESELVLIPGGVFTMGEGNQAHLVPVDSFYLGKYEVTNAQWKVFVDANPDWRKDGAKAQQLASREYLAHWEGYSPPAGKENHPVVNVNWHAARAYCAWAGLRLPTEAEWEYAAQGGKGYEYGTATGELRPELANYGLQVQDTTEVGNYPANPFGIHDLAGNVWEWCSSLMKPYPYDANDGRENEETNGDRVCRGGCWYSVEKWIRARERLNAHPEDCCHGHGFRVACGAQVVWLVIATQRRPDYAQNQRMLVAPGKSAARRGAGGGRRR